MIQKKYIFLLITFSFGYCIQAQTTQEKKFDTPTIPEVNSKIIEYVNSLLINQNLDDINLIYNSLEYAKAEPLISGSYGEQYSDFHLIIPGDIIQILSNVEKNMENATRYPNNRYDYLYNQVAIVTHVSSDRFKIIYYGQDSQKEQFQIYQQFFIFDEIVVDRIVFFHPIKSK